jgi:methionyl aminopeptidase
MAKRKRRQRAVHDVAPSEPPVRPGLLSPSRTVPREVPRPPYAVTGNPGPSVSSLVRTPDEIAAMRRAGAAAAEILLRAGDAVAVGVTTDEIDRLVHDHTIELGGYPSPLNYKGFPKSVCTSVNEVICHGIPDSRPLADGDIMNIDVTIYLDGVHGDTSATFLVGDVDPPSVHLVTETRRSLELGIAAARPGGPLNLIGRAIESHAISHGLGVVREFIGHGVGTEFHSNLQIPHYHDRRASAPIELGTSFTIEPMLTLGAPESLMWDDGWTATTRDGRRTAQFEHTLLMGEHGAEIMTVTESGACAHELVLASVA